ncbi:MAG TPA: cytochrome P450 [Chloroflexota bacterium]|jgi:cytochrome P450
MKRLSVGEVQSLFREYGAQAWLEMVLRHGKTFRVQEYVVTCDPRLVEPLMLDRAHTRRRSKPHRMLGRIPGAKGLLFLDGPRWEAQHRALAPTVTREHVAHYADLIHAATLEWTRTCRGGPDLVAAMTGLGSNIVLRTGYGLDPSDPLARDYARELIGYKHRAEPREPRYRLDVLAIGAEKLLSVPWLCSSFISLHRRTARMRRLVPRLLAERARCPVHASNWFDRLAAEQLPLSDLTSALNHLYGAYNTLDYMTAAVLYDLSRHSEWRERIRTELTTALDDRPYPTTDEIQRVPLLWGAIRETLRLYPVATSIFRQTGAPLELDGERIPAGSQVAILPYALHRHPDYWEDPHAFKPDRWARSPLPFTYIPFLIGPRKCLGQPQAELELLIRVSTILRAVDVDVDVDPQSAVLTPYILPRFATDLPFRVSPSHRETSLLPPGRRANALR